MSAATAAAALAQQQPEVEPADLRALRLLLGQSEDFRLAIALYNDPVRRDGWIRTLVDELGREGVRILTLDLLRDTDRERGLLDRVQMLAAGIPPRQRFAIMVVNIETTVDYAPELSLSDGPGTAFLHAANLQRELFPTACHGLLVLWMTELMEQAFIRCAPDLWSWRNHVFDLRTRKGPMGPILDGAGRAFSSHDYRLHPETRLRRLQEELAAYRRTGSRRDEMRVLNSIGIAWLEVGESKVARLDFEAAVQIAREIGDAAGERNALGNLGNAHAEMGVAHKAIEYHEQALAISREIGDRGGEGNALANLGNAYLQLGEPRKAADSHEKALVIMREIGDRRGEGKCLDNLGLAYAGIGGARKAIELFEKRIVIARELGDRRGEGQGLGNLGLAHTALGDASKAIELFQRRLVIARELGDRRGEGHTQWGYALAEDLLGNRPEAIVRATAALTIYEAIESPSAAKVRAQLAAWGGAVSRS